METITKKSQYSHMKKINTNTGIRIKTNMRTDSNNKKAHFVGIRKL